MRVDLPEDGFAGTPGVIVLEVLLRLDVDAPEGVFEVVFVLPLTSTVRFTGRETLLRDERCELDREDAGAGEDTVERDDERELAG